MRVLMCIRSDYLRNFGGDSVQMIKTAEHLRKLGVDVDINSGDITDFSPYDLIHLFNLTRMGETYKYYKIARHYKKDIVLSPLYWDMTRYFHHINDVESIKLWERCNIYRREIVKGCKAVYPNSHIEAEQLKKLICKSANYIVVYNGVDIISEETPLYGLKDRYRLDNYILCVGRICPIKNQLVLARICKELNINLVLIGNIEDRVYYDKCMSYHGTQYLGFIDSYNIYNAYRFAKLHVLPSFVETSGRSSLEAAASGCTIVSTDQSNAREYFGDMATYCNPYDEASIYEAVKQGLKAKKDSELKNFISEKHNWESCTKVLYDSYMASF
ncbi:glycosyltransferase family 4 protein [Clostridium thermarum]|uniref:glycosyltransferase family 4 protein n=1 Tax=Clostridium thermarum TaxID=1716543 RepID=UPI0013D039D5|nr:glycosyltransferase family 4 protein [Clostridium thermarum]